MTDFKQPKAVPDAIISKIRAGQESASAAITECHIRRGSICIHEESFFFFFFFNHNRQFVKEDILK